MTSYQVCNSGFTCLNPDQSHRPTRLELDGTESQVTGFCSYCRKAGIGAPRVGASSVGNLPPAMPNDFSSRPETDAEREARLQRELEEFDPKADEFDDSGLDSEPLEKIAAEKHQPRTDSEAPAWHREVALTQATDQISPPKRKRGRPPKVRPETAVSADTSAAARLSDPLAETSVYPVYREATVPEQPQTPKARAAEPEKVQTGRSGSEASSSSSSSSGGVLKDPSRFIGLASTPVQAPPRSSLLSNGDVSFGRRLGISCQESLRGVYDVVSTAGRLAVSNVGFGLVAVSALLGLPMILGGPRGIVRYVRSVLKTGKLVRYGLSPFLDGRAVAACSISALAYAPALQASLGYAASNAISMAGLAGLAAWPVYRGMRGLITGRVLGPHRVFAWRRGPSLRASYRNPQWTQTSHLSSAQIAELNTRFEQTTGEAIAGLGFKVTLGGQQNAVALGHVGPGDGGVDVLARGSSGDMLVISCKRYAEKVGVQEVRDIFAVASSRKYAGAKPMLVTTVGFTEGAVRFAADNGVLLTTLDALIEHSMKYTH